MARKRLSDLLREEEQKGGEKSPEPETEQVSASPEVAKPDAAEPVVAVTGEVIAPDDLSQADRGDLRNAAAEPEPTPPAQTSDTRFSDAQAATQAALEGTIEQMKTELKSFQQMIQGAQTKATTLQAQIDQLNAETAAQQNKIQQLQAEVEQSEQVKTELEAAKQMILKLSQPSPAANKATKPAPSVLPSVRAAEPELDSKPVQMVVPAAKATPSDRPKLHQMALRKVLDHPIQPGSLPPMPSEAKIIEKEIKLSDADVGWMD